MQLRARLNWQSWPPQEKDLVMALKLTCCHSEKESRLLSLRTLQLGALCGNEAPECFCCLRLELTVWFPGAYVNTPSPFVIFNASPPITEREHNRENDEWQVAQLCTSSVLDTGSWLVLLKRVLWIAAGDNATRCEPMKTKKRTDS